jgi:hypothetical protein
LDEANLGGRRTVQMEPQQESIAVDDHHPLGPLALLGQTNLLAALFGAGKGPIEEGDRLIQLALLVEGGQSGTPDALSNPRFTPASQSSPHRR